ncbi:MAG TPA: hypothetical protein VHS52_04110 [Acidimicrobiales bacterium]|nr:hypothetical protein [Acidimicrobiales bacterium]
MTTSSAWAQTYTGVTPPKLSGAAVPAVVTQAAPVRSVQVASAPAPDVSTAPVGGLAFTGADVLGLVALGALLVLVGTFITRSTRRRSPS